MLDKDEVSLAKNRNQLDTLSPWEPTGCSPALAPGASVAKGQTDTPINRHNRREVPCHLIYS